MAANLFRETAPLVSEITDGFGNRIRRYEIAATENHAAQMQLRVKLTVRAENAGITVRDVEQWYWRYVGTTHSEIFVLPTEEDHR